MRTLFFILFYLLVSNLIAQPQTSNQDLTDLSLIFLCNKDTMKLHHTLQPDYHTKINSSKLIIRMFELREDSLRDISKYSAVLKSVKYVCRFTSYEEGIDRSMRLVIYKEDKEYMVIYFRINKQNEPYLTFHLPMTISIQKGIFEVIDPEKPELIPVKKGKK